MFINNQEKSNLHPEIPSTTVANQDRRYLPRWEVDNKIIFQKDKEDELHECQSKDITATGVCLRVKGGIPLQQALDLTIYLANDIEPVRVHGKTVWQQKKDDESLIGVQFNTISNTSSEQIFHYAFEYRKQDLMKHWFKGF